MKIKSGVNLTGVTTEMQHANAKAALVWQAMGQELVITSGMDGKHMEGSKHYTGDACDYRTHYFTSDKDVALAASILRHRLGDNYDVVIEKTHIHCEYDPQW